ncbi:MAG: glycosyltransferase [Thermoguttaceae bacterium]|jgi:glycosyltransferase involved in cell wall biosynthesis
MRVLWVHNFPPDVVSSGVFMHILYEQMRSLGVDVTLHYTGNLRSPVRMLRAARQLRAVAGEYDLVHAQFGSACGLITSFTPGAKLVTLRGTDLRGMDFGSVWHRAHGFLARLFSRVGLRRYRNIIVMSERMRREVRQICSSAEIDVVPSGIDLDRFQPMDRMEARRRLGEGRDGSPWVLFSSLQGVTNPIKRAPLARAAIEVLQSTRPDVQLKVLTGVPHDRLPLWINACNAVLLTSTREGWPNIIKEALACNVPFVSTDVSDLAAIAEAEPNCFVADAVPQALARALAETLDYRGPSNLRRRVAPMAVDAIGHRLLGIYHRLCPSETLTNVEFHS